MSDAIGTITLHNDSNLDTIEIPGLDEAEIMDLVERLLDPMQEDALGPVPNSTIPAPLSCKNEIDFVPENVLDMDEERCQLLQVALLFKKTRDLAHANFVAATKRRQMTFDTINEYKEIFSNLSKPQRYRKLTGYRQTMAKLWDRAKLEIEDARQAWAKRQLVCGFGPRIVQIEEQMAWEKYFDFLRAEENKELKNFDFNLRQLRQLEFNRFDTSGWGSEMHDEEWAQGTNDNHRERWEQEYDAAEAYWGANRTYLPAKDKRARARQLRRAEIMMEAKDAEDAFLALIAEM